MVVVDLDPGTAAAAAEAEDGAPPVLAEAGGGVAALAGRGRWTEMLDLSDDTAAVMAPAAELFEEEGGWSFRATLPLPALCCFLPAAAADRTAAETVKLELAAAAAAATAASSPPLPTVTAEAATTVSEECGPVLLPPAPLPPPLVLSSTLSRAGSP